MIINDDNEEVEYNDPMKDLVYDYYVETSTGFIYEATLFDGFALARPADPWFYTAVRKIDFKTFAYEFEQYCGDSDALRRMTGGGNEIMAISDV